MTSMTRNKSLLALSMFALSHWFLWRQLWTLPSTERFKMACLCIKKLFHHVHVCMYVCRAALLWTGKAAHLQHSTAGESKPWYESSEGSKCWPRYSRKHEIYALTVQSLLILYNRLILSPSKIIYKFIMLTYSLLLSFYSNRLSYHIASVLMSLIFSIGRFQVQWDITEI